MSHEAIGIVMWSNLQVCVSSGCGRLRQTWMHTCKQIIGRYWVERRAAGQNDADSQCGVL